MFIFIISTLIAGSLSTGGQLCKYRYPEPPPPHFQVLGGTGYLFFHYWPPVKREPAINVDMVNKRPAMADRNNQYRKWLTGQRTTSQVPLFAVHSQ